MHVPRPTAAPPGRLVRLGVVLDTRNPVERLLDVARMCDRAGIGALWVEDAAEAPGRPGAGHSEVALRPDAASGRPGEPDGPAPGAARLDGWTALALLTGEVRTARVGALLDAAEWAPQRLARMAATLGARTAGRLELTLRADGAGLLALREALAATTVPAVLAPSRGGTVPAIVPAPGPAFGSAALPAVPPTLAVEIAADELSPEVLAAVDDVLLPMGPPTATVAAALAVRRAAAAAGRGRETLGVAARLPVSVGRTVAEAQARWDAEAGFAALGPPAETGLFGTLEQCHDRVIELAQAGVTELRCLLPNAIDVHDVIAQLTAMTIGSADKLVAGAPRTRVPEPPAGWGGRSRFPRPD